MSRIKNKHHLLYYNDIIKPTNKKHKKKMFKLFLWLRLTQAIVFYNQANLLRNGLISTLKVSVGKQFIFAKKKGLNYKNLAHKSVWST